MDDPLKILLSAAKDLESIASEWWWVACIGVGILIITITYLLIR